MALRRHKGADRPMLAVENPHRVNQRIRPKIPRLVTTPRDISQQGHPEQARFRCLEGHSLRLIIMLTPRA